jgi:parvulin-like peptidyl-prolyl isomerase
MKRHLPVPVLLLLFGVAGAATVPVKAEILEQILVKVNGDIITKTDLEQRQVAYLRQRNQQFDPKDIQNDESLKKVLADITPGILRDTIDELLLTQRGRELGWKLTEDHFKEIVDRIRKENKIETEEQFQAALKQEGMTMTDLRRQLERQMLVSQVQQREVMGKLSVTEADERAYYRDHAGEFTSQPTVSLREILVQVAPTDKSKGINVGAEDDAKEKAERARTRIAAGEDFAKVAAEMSDAPSKANGGLVGPINRSELAPALQERLAKMAPGDLTDVMRTQRGYHLVRLETSSEAVTQSFEDVRAQISDKVFQLKRQAEFEKYLKRLRQQAIIEWKNDDLKKLYEQRVNTPAEPQAVGAEG